MILFDSRGQGQEGEQDTALWENEYLWKTPADFCVP
jgi:hypothetical protein